MSTAGASVAFDHGGTATTVELPLTFFSEYPGSYTADIVTIFGQEGRSPLWTACRSAPGPFSALPPLPPSLPSVRVGSVGPVHFSGAFTHFSSASTLVSNSLSLSAPSAPSVVALNGTLHIASTAPIRAQTFSIQTGNEAVNASINLIAGVPSATSIETSSWQIFEGGSASVTVSIGGYGPTPTGTVTPDDGSTVLEASALSNGEAVFQLSSLGDGVQAITAAYSGDNVFLPSKSGVGTLSVFDFSISNSPSSLSLVACGSATSFITITPGSSGFPSAIRSPAPALPQCDMHVEPLYAYPRRGAATATLTLASLPPSTNTTFPWDER